AHERAVAGLEGLLEHLREARALSRASRDRRLVGEELRRMVAHLLELRERGQHDPLPLYAFGPLDRLLGLADDGGIERRLLPGERAVDLHLHLLREVLDDRAVGLEPPQDEGTGEPPQPLEGLRVLARLDRDEVALLERRLRAEQAGVQE